MQVFLCLGILITGFLGDIKFVENIHFRFLRVNDPVVVLEKHRHFPSFLVLWNFVASSNPHFDELNHHYFIILLFVVSPVVVSRQCFCSFIKNGGHCILRVNLIGIRVLYTQIAVVLEHLHSSDWTNEAIINRRRSHNRSDPINIVSGEWPNYEQRLQLPFCHYCPWP